MDKQPNKVKYNYGEELDLTGATIKVIKSSGVYKVTVTKDMISGYSSTTPGTQVITVTYSGETTNFIVIVGEKPETTVETKDNTNENKPNENNSSVRHNRTSTPKSTNDETVIDESRIEDVVETPNTTEDKKDNNKLQENQKPQVEEKPTATLGDKEENEDSELKIKVLAGMAGIAGLIILIILLINRKNTKIYVQEDENEYVLGGKEKLNKRNKTIDIDQYLDGNTYPNKVKIILDKKISQKLDKQEIKIKHRGKIIKRTVKFNDEEFEIILE